MRAISVKEEYEEDLCQFKMDNQEQRLLLNAVSKVNRVGSKGADVSKNIFPKQQDSECPDIKKEVSGQHHCEKSQAGSHIAPMSHFSDTNNEQSKGTKNKSDSTGTTTNVGKGCGNKNTEQPMGLSRKSLTDVHQSEADSFSYSEDSYACEMNTEQQSPLSLVMLEEEEHQAEDSFSYATESFLCQMPRCTKNFHGRELPQHQRDLIVQRYQSGDGYKRISKALNIPWNTVKSVLVRWKKNGTTVTLPRSGRPSKIDEKTRKELVREVVKRPTATLKELQEFLANTGCSVHATTISRILHKSGLWGRVAR
ncbi:uncharacterized protein LOC144196367 isoform X1 [Stigmatopora nigra]